MSMAAAIAILRDAYPRQEFPDRSVALYGAALADLDDQQVSDAIGRLVKTHQWLPSVAEIRREVAEHEAGLPGVDEAWSAVAEALHRGDRSVTAGQPEVAGAIHDCGGWYGLKQMPLQTARRSFREAYAARRETTVEAIQTGATRARPVLTAAPTLAALPASERIRPRPVMARLLHRMSGKAVGEPTDAEMRDAIDLLREGPTEHGDPDPLFIEAQRILDDADRAVGERLAALSAPGR